MLRKVVVGVGALLLLLAAVQSAQGQFQAVFPLALGGFTLTVGVLLERWRYRKPESRQPDPHWTRTNEKFVDTETGQLTEVYYDPRDGQTHYLTVGK
jgi:hypothetical protein